MFNTLCLLLITTSCWQHVKCRHIIQHPYYSPYTDYSYTYSRPSHFHQPNQRHHSTIFSPPGTYFDHRQGILRPFPGGGVAMLIDYHKRCSDSFIGVKAHPDQQDRYYVCKPDCIIFGKCQNLQIFNATSGQCVQHPTPDYIPTCTTIGRFPVFSDCHLYFKCDEDLLPKIYSCPHMMIFSQASNKCITGNKCTPTQISPNSSYISGICTNNFPPCFENGVFRSATDCSLYYKCDLKKSGSFMQTRLKCPEGNFYDLQKKKCLPAKEVSCDCIQLTELVYPKANTLPIQPAVYSMVENHYPVEQTYDSVTEISNNSEEEENITTTISTPTELNEFMQPDDLKLGALPNHVNITEPNDKTQSKEEELSSYLSELVNSSEESAIIEGSGFETDAEILFPRQVQMTTEGSYTIVTTEETEDLSEPGTTIKVDKETTDEPEISMEEFSLTTNNVIVPNETETEENEEVFTTITSATSKETEDCKNLTNIEGDAVTETQNSDFNSGNIPRLEIVAERPINIRLSICPSICDQHNKTSTIGRRAVLLKWFARKSKETIGFETGNDLNTED